MEGKFTVDEGPENDRRLCPGEYSVRGCETKEADFDARVQNIKSVIDRVTEISPVHSLPMMSQ